MTQRLGEAPAKIFWRGLREIEVAVVKRMRQVGLPRDYIFSFLAEPGRILTPACVNEIVGGEIGGEVEPASDAVVRLFVNERLNSIRPLDDLRFDEPVSPWRIQQALLWARTKQTQLFHEEGYETEFKIIFERTEEKLARYMKTMAAFANEGGGYIFFGVDDNGRATSFDAERFKAHDWDAFDKQLEDRFCTYVRWHHTIVDVPQSPELRFDAELIRREARDRGVPEEQYKWIIDAGTEAATRQVGVIYSYKAETRVICRKPVGKALRAGACYVRRLARNGQFEEQELDAFEVGARQLAKPDDTAAIHLKDYDQKLVALHTPAVKPDVDDQPELPLSKAKKRRKR